MAGIFIYTISCVPLSNAWKILLVSLEGEARVPDRLLITFARSQLGKYLPGNVAHIAGRHIIANGHGYTNQALVLSTIYEISGLLSAAGLSSSVALIFSESAILDQFPLVFAVPVLAFVLPLLYLAHYLAPRFAGLRHIRPFASRANAPALLFIPYLYYLTFFLLAGNALVLLTWPIESKPDSYSYLIIWLAFSTSWTLGFLTPGAPSGIGVREAVLVYILSPMLGTPDAIIVSVLFRVVTVGGDLLFWLLMEARTRYLKSAT
jgi:uncharacterized membrane protein YbhN (UPF0104 family)